jgi:hypothetical protein
MAPPPPGFDARDVSAPDAVVTIRSLRRRFAEAFDQADDPSRLTQRDAGGQSPLGHAAWTAHALDVIRSALSQVVMSDHPDVELPPADPAPSVVGDLDTPAAVLGRLGESARALADAMSEVHAKDWSRAGHAPTGEISALDIARRAVQIGIEHLHAAQEAIARR